MGWSRIRVRIADPKETDAEVLFWLQLSERTSITYLDKEG
jgi:hypothetical protein